jgi:hypothetical protein
METPHFSVERMSFLKFIKMEKNVERLFVNSRSWTIKRALIVSAGFACIYAGLNTIWIWIFGSNSETILDMGLTKTDTFTLVLGWNSWWNILPNYLMFTAFGVFLFGVIRYIDWRFKIKKMNDGSSEYYSFMIGLIWGIILLGGISSEGGARGASIASLIFVCVFAILGSSKDEQAKIDPNLLDTVLSGALGIGFAWGMIFGLDHGPAFALFLGIIAFIVWTIPIWIGLLVGRFFRNFLLGISKNPEFQK